MLTAADARATPLRCADNTSRAIMDAEERTACRVTAAPTNGQPRRGPP